MAIVGKVDTHFGLIQPNSIEFHLFCQEYSPSTNTLRNLESFQRAYRNVNKSVALIYAPTQLVLNGIVQFLYHHFDGCHRLTKGLASIAVAENEILTSEQNELIKVDRNP